MRTEVVVGLVTWIRSGNGGVEEGLVVKGCGGYGTPCNKTNTNTNTNDKYEVVVIGSWWRIRTRGFEI